MSSLKYLLAVVIVATLANSAAATFCYDCDSRVDPNCGSDFNRTGIKVNDCSSPLLQLLLGERRSIIPGHCVKVTRKIDGSVVVMRTCAVTPVSNGQKECVKDISENVSCYICEGDKCNSSPSLAPFAVAVIAAFFGLARIFS